MDICCGDPRAGMEHLRIAIMNIPGRVRIYYPACKGCGSQSRAPSVVQMPTLEVRTQRDLAMLLGDLIVQPEAGNIMLGSDVIDVEETYCANCRDLPSRRHIVIPGFGREAFARDADAALAKFRQFCRSQFGQCRKRGWPLRFVFCDRPLERVLFCFNCPQSEEIDWFYGEEYLVLRPGMLVVPLAPPSAAMGWKYGFLLESGTCGWYPPAFVDA